jgi:hypothetical protein
MKLTHRFAQLTEKGPQDPHLNGRVCASKRLEHHGELSYRPHTPGAATYLPEGILHIVSILVSFCVIAVLFSMMFKWLLDVNVGWHACGLAPFSLRCCSNWGNWQIGFSSESRDRNPPFGAAASHLPPTWIQNNANAPTDSRATRDRFSTFPSEY